MRAIALGSIQGEGKIRSLIIGAVLITLGALAQGSLHGHGFREVARLIDVASLRECDVIRKQL